MEYRYITESDIDDILLLEKTIFPTHLQYTKDIWEQILHDACYTQLIEQNNEIIGLILVRNDIDTYNIITLEICKKTSKKRIWK